MGYSIGLLNGRDIGYGVTAYCDKPVCYEVIDRGMSYACGGFASDDGCGLYFCINHLEYETDESDSANQFCDVCAHNLRLGSDKYKEHKSTYDPKLDHPDWMWWKLNHESWDKWRTENEKEAQFMRETLRDLNYKPIKELQEWLKQDSTDETH